MIDALLKVPSHLRERLASALQSGLLSPPYEPVALQATLGGIESETEIVDALRELERLGITGEGAAAWLGTVDQASRQTLKPDLVWSGPEVPGLHARDTRRVYEELIGAAQQSMWISTYVYFDGSKMFERLARQMDAAPALNVTLLLNIQRKWGDTTAPDYLVRRFAERFWETDWPGSRRPRIFYDPRSLETDGPASVLHAKAVVVDDETVFVTSANLTEAALDRNIELGLLVRDGALAKSVSAHFHTLIDQKLLRPLPVA
ncbi:MAG: DISARM system phospholipase D-like protein DrmC [Candidatus Hydrogenedentota bacterium]